MKTYAVTISYTYNISADSEDEAKEIASEMYGDDAPRNDEVNYEVEKSMYKYLCYIKSHCEAPDFEYEVEAENMKEALKQLAKITHWSVKDLEKYVTCASDLCPECSTLLLTKIEQRSGGYLETVSYCNGCGWTGVHK